MSSVVPDPALSDWVPLWNLGGQVRNTVSAAPPANPQDGDLWTLPDVSGANNGLRWRFQYNANSTSAYKWEFIGGQPYHVVLAGYNAIAGDGAWHNNGFGLLAPRAGDYRVRYSASVYFTTAVAGAVYINMALGTGSTVSAADVSLQSTVIATYFAGTIFTEAQEMAVAGVAAGQGIYEITLVSSGMTVQLGNRSLNITPLRVS